MLIAKNLTKSYKSRKVVRDISLELKPGEIVGLLGPNGAGKTTSFYMLVGLVSCDSGSIIINNQNVTTKAMHVRAHNGIGYLPQEASVFRKLSVADNIMAILQVRAELSDSDRQQKLENLLEEFQLQDIRNSLGISLSGGERRRVEIARALASEPKFILLDEPFAGVDPISVLDIKQFIRRLKEKGIGILITDHNVRETLDICQRGYIVADGKIIASGTPSELINNEQVKAVYLGEEFKL